MVEVSDVKSPDGSRYWARTEDSLVGKTNENPTDTS